MKSSLSLWKSKLRRNTEGKKNIKRIWIDRGSWKSSCIELSRKKTNQTLMQVFEQIRIGLLLTSFLWICSMYMQKKHLILKLNYLNFLHLPSTFWSTRQNMLRKLTAFWFLLCCNTWHSLFHHNGRKFKLWYPHIH